MLTLYLQGSSSADDVYDSNAARCASLPSILFTGDSSAREILSHPHLYIKTMQEENGKLAVGASSPAALVLTVFKVPHHGSDNNSWQQEDVDAQRRLFDHTVDEYERVSSLLNAYLVGLCCAYTATDANAATYLAAIQVRLSTAPHDIHQALYSRHTRTQHLHLCCSSTNRSSLDENEGCSSS